MPPTEDFGAKDVKDVKDVPSLSGDEVVISGISGVFPNSDSVLDFMNNLYNKVDMVTEEPKWNINNPDIPKHVGKITGTDKFDAQFFGVSYHLACALEPMARKLLEHAYGAIFDSGTNPQSLRGKRVGVFVGVNFTDNSTLSMYNVNKRTDFVINGCSKAMLANRISYWIDSKGPSYGLDYACSGSTACLEIAYKSIKSGECDAAIIGGCNFGLHPTLAANLRRAGLLCLDGKTKCFDKNGDGYVRADAINVIFLQKAKDAHRIYTQVYHAKGIYKMRPDAQFLPYRESEDIEKFLNEFYKETDVDPKRIEYVEAHAAAIAKADENELRAIGNIFAKENSVKVGSVKSNMGNSESASGICALTKLCLAYHQGKLPANLHYNDPQDNVPAVKDERIQVVTDNADFNRGFTAMNNFSFSGANFHVLLKGQYKEKNLQKYECQIPRLVLASGREETCVHKIIDILKSHPIDAEEIGLLHKIFEYDIPGHTGRGYTILDTNENQETVSIAESADYYPGLKRPLWFVYSGMGSQWAGMGADLMRIPIFANAIHKCHKVLEPLGLNLIRIVTEPDNSIFDNILNAFVGIGAIQIGLTDVIKAMGIVPDYIIGHSLGEMACAYHDNTFTAEELILATYSRGKVCLETDLIKGSMAAVGVGYQAIVNQCPPEIDIACHNSHESSTISGPADKMTEFVGELTKRGIFAKEVPCANIAYHSRYIAQCGPELLRRLREVIKSPKKRSSKWISTSVPQDRWDQPESVYSSAEYHTNNLLKPVLFEETSKMIPDNAIVVEIAPHGLLQAILKRSHKECTHIPLTRRGNTNGVKFLLEAVGKLYEAGVNPRVDVLYPKIEFPVSTETPLLSHFVAWEHSEDWPQMSFLEKDEVRTAMERKVILSTHDDDYNFLEGHLRNGANVLPESAILVLVWETLAMHIGVSYRDQPVVFRDIHFHSEIVLKLDTPLRLTVAINRGSNKFEVSQDDIRIASGIVSGVKVVKYNQDPEIMANDEEEIILNSEDVYNIFRSRGYSYRDQFKSIESSTLDHKKAFVQWSGEWVTFLDSLIQLTTLSRNHEGISTPKFIRKIRISILEQQISNSVEVNGNKCFPAQYDEVQGVIRCAGVELDSVTFVDKPVINQHPEVLLTKSFYPHYAMDQVDMKTALQIMLQIVAENTTMKKIKTTQIVTSNTNIICIIKGISTLIPNVMIDVASIINVNIDFDTLLVQNSDADKANIFIIEDLFGNKKKLNSLKNISNDSFIIALECGVPALQSLNENFTIISSMSDGKQILILLKRRNPKDVTYVPVNCDNKLNWVSRVYNKLNKTKRVMLVSERQSYCGALGFVNKLKSDGEDKIGLIAIDDCHAPTFDYNIGIYKHQMNKNLTVNIFRKGQWGGYYYTSATKSTSLRDVALVSPNGDLENLTWVEAPNTITKHNLVKVSYSGISSKDVQKAVGNLGDDLIPLGMDFSGTNADGDRVMGLVAGGALSTTVKADSDLLWPVPEYWSLQDAATVPLPYAVAYYCLAIKSRLFKGQSVFVTGGAGALGQAVIAVCLSLECFVFTTVSSMKKKSMLLQLFPGLNEKNICFSRDDSFLSMIKMYAPNKGCDIVINCTSGYIRETAMKCTGNMGFFLDLSAYDMIENKDIGMSYLEKDRSYKAVNFSSIFRPENAPEKKILQRMLAEGIANGTVRPISRIEYTPTQISRAFRLVSSSKHIGKVIIKMSSPEVVKGFDVVPSMNYNSNGVYIVVCDDNGIGIELADRLVKRGARKIVLHTRTKVCGYWDAKFASWEKQKVTIKISTENLESQQGCTKMLKEASRIGFIRGIFIVPDTEDKNDEKPLDFVQTFNKATFSVINLDLTSKNYCNELSHFVVLLPPSCSNEYSYALLERICQMRSENGLPALIVRMDTLTVGDSKTILEPQKLMAFFNGMENSLKLKYNNVLTLGLNEENVADYEMKLAKIFGVPKIEAFPEHFTVGDLLLTKDNLIELQTLIRNTHKVDYPVENIVNMTVESLKNVKNQNTAEPKKYKGLGAFYTCVDNEEEHMSTSHPIVPMVTLLNNGTENDLDPQETYLTLIPGFEGRYQIFSGLAERLKVQAVAVQLTADIEGNSIEEMAATVRKFMKTKFESKSKFYLLGYSFGVNIALEVAAILEKEGYTGVVYCLDSSPDALRIQLNSYLGEISDTELQNSILEHISQLIAGKVPEELGQYLEQINDWPTKVDACLYTLRGIGNYSKQYKGFLLDFAYRNILFAKNYEPKLKLNSEIVLIKGKPELQSQSLSADYNLSKYTKNPVKVYHIESDHPSALYDSRVTNIVNKLLDENLLKEFKNKNLCDKYIIQLK